MCLLFVLDKEWLTVQLGEKNAVFYSTDHGGYFSLKTIVNDIDQVSILIYDFS